MEKNIPHKNAEVIKAWAEGKVIQWGCSESHDWTDYDRDKHTYGPWDNAINDWRIKPEVKPDVVKYAQVYGSRYNMQDRITLGSVLQDRDNLKLTFDGETGKLKSAEVI